MDRACGTYWGEDRNAYEVLVGKPDEKRTLGRHGHRWKGNMEMELRERGWEDMA